MRVGGNGSLRFAAVRLFGRQNPRQLSGCSGPGLVRGGLAWVTWVREGEAGLTPVEGSLLPSGLGRMGREL